jgi:chaperonin GroES
MNYNSANPEMQEEAQSPATDLTPDVALQNENLAKKYDEEKLMDIGVLCRQGFENDLKSREEWEHNLDDWLNLAKQVRETRSYPWPNASNVKYPLLSTAAMQFAARAYPSLVPSNGKIVKTVVIGKDHDGQKLERAERVSTYMSHQIMYEMHGWEEDMDKMLMALPVVGTMFKKTYYDPGKDAICSKMITPKDIVVNYWTRNLDEAERISEIIQMTPRVLKERQNQAIFLDVELDTPQAPDGEPSTYSDDATIPHELVEQHTFLDLDDDGYAEPYIVTFERKTGKILRISVRYSIDDVEKKDNGGIKKITAQQYYTKFGFVPNPDGSFYDIGFGILLGPLNESVNTIINQLIDAGSMANLQSGFIGKSLRLKMGDARFQPGEWKPVNATGDDLRKQIVPLPAKDPSDTLFQLMGTLVTSGKELASVAEIFVGKMPGQNTPATTTMASIEQGMKVFTAVYKRLYRSLAVEFKKIYKLNKLYTDPNKYTAIIDTTIGPDDFDDESYDICPGADPTAVSQTEKLLKAQGLLELLPLIPGLLDPIQVYSRILEAQEQPNWQQLFSKEVQESGALPPPPPDPKLMAIQAKAESDQRKAAVDIQAKQMEMELDGRDRAMQMQMEQQAHAQKMQMEQEKALNKSASDIAMANIFASTERAKGQQTLINNQQAHQQKMQQAKETSKLQTSKSGGKTTSQKK